jgi:hypothetical protein
MNEVQLVCECGRHFYHYTTRTYVARLSSGMVILKQHAWPPCVQKLDAERLARAEEITKNDLHKVGD